MKMSTHITIGSISNGMKIIHTLANDKPSTNKQVAVQCTSCGMEKIVWSSNFKAGKVVCPRCKLRDKLIDRGNELAAYRPLATLDQGIFKIMWDCDIPAIDLYTTHGDKLWIAVNSQSFIPWTPEFLEAPEKASIPTSELPKQPPEYTNVLEAPSDYIPYLTSTSDANEDAAEAFATTNFPAFINEQGIELFAGVKGPWSINGKLWNYLYYLLPGESREAIRVDRPEVVELSEARKEEMRTIYAKKVADMEREKQRLAAEAEAEEADRMRRIALAQGELSDLLNPKPKPKPLAKPLDSPVSSLTTLPTIPDLNNLFGA